MASFKSADMHDFATDVVPMEHRRWHWLSIGNVLIGVATAMFFMAWGGELTQKFGGLTTILSMIIGTITIGGAGFLFALLGSRYGLSSNLLSREIYGRYGSAIATFIYAFNYVMFYAFEGAIMIAAIRLFLPGTPPWAIYVAFTVVMILLAVYGMKLMARFMWLTLPIYILGVILLFAFHPKLGTLSFAGWVGAGPHFGMAALGGAVATVFALITMSTQGADYGRMLKPGHIRIGSLALGFGVMFVTFCLVTLLGSYVGTSLGQTNPGKYFVTTLGGFGLFVVLITQIRINIVNMYSGSLAYSNTLGMVGVKDRAWIRSAAAMVVAVAGVLLIALGIFTHLLEVLTIEGLFIMAWGASVISYYWLTGRPGAQTPEIDPARLRGFEPIGMITLVISLVVSIPLELHVLGSDLSVLAPFINIMLALGLPAILYRWVPACRISNVQTIGAAS
ncbi:purine-cytosine permease family protein [Acidiphilium acidophilum]|uniref:Cytosine permease n=1 Tax=Acidiphilium acidophilum TaxID=76588 RepID=A0AAW9DL45_ACIAO|nr:cytosine permease [Acidiphilium acidophilum]MDX5929788.1 cytosine permease [Acidiphilium acidophilum]